MSQISKLSVLRACEGLADLLFAALSSARICDACDAGKFAMAEGSTVCTDCAAGKSSEAGFRDCPSCLSGKYSLQGGSCQNCAWNTHSLGGEAQCSKCTVGKYSDPPNACTSCIKGQYLNPLFMAPTHSTVLLPCLECQPCLPGTERAACRHEFECDLI
jgi:hypothetical protein